MRDNISSLGAAFRILLSLNLSIDLASSLPVPAVESTIDAASHASSFSTAVPEWLISGHKLSKRSPAPPDPEGGESPEDRNRINQRINQEDRQLGEVPWQ